VLVLQAILHLTLQIQITQALRQVQTPQIAMPIKLLLHLEHRNEQGKKDILNNDGYCGSANGWHSVLL
jgi:hypothetical protein